jgi:hypothetical protein
VVDKVQQALVVAQREAVEMIVEALVVVAVRACRVTRPRARARGSTRVTLVACHVQAAQRAQRRRGCTFEVFKGTKADFELQRTLCTPRHRAEAAKKWRYGNPRKCVWGRGGRIDG